MDMFSRIKAAIKYLLSFTKNDWQLSDYPIRLQHQKRLPQDAEHNRLKLIPWVAQIINGEESNDGLNKRILDEYGVDVSDIRNGNLVKIFELCN